MHELAIIQSIVDLVAERTAGRRVLSVRVSVGRLSGVVPEAMSFCYDVATAGSPLEGTTLVIEEVDGLLSCRTCGAESPADDLVLLCPCGSADVAVVEGQDLRVTAVELEREASCA